MATVTPRRHKRMCISLEMIARLIDVPDDVRVLALAAAPDPFGGLVLTLESDRFDEVPANAEAPVHHSVLVDVLTDVDDDPSPRRGPFVRYRVDV